MSFQSWNRADVQAPDASTWRGVNQSKAAAANNNQVFILFLSCFQGIPVFPLGVPTHIVVPSDTVGRVP